MTCLSQGFRVHRTQDSKDLGETVECKVDGPPVRKRKTRPLKGEEEGIHLCQVWVWHMGYNVWSMTYGVQCMEYDIWGTMYGV